MLYCQLTAGNAVLSVNSTQWCTVSQQNTRLYCQSTAHNALLPVKSTKSCTVSQQHTMLYCQSAPHNAVLSVNSTKSCTVSQQHTITCSQSTALNPVLSVNSTQSRTASQQHTILYCQLRAHNPVLSVNSTQSCSVSQQHKSRTVIQQHTISFCQSTAHNPLLSINSTQSCTVSQQHTIPWQQLATSNAANSLGENLLYFLMKEMVHLPKHFTGKFWDMICFRWTKKAGSPKYVRTLQQHQIKVTSLTAWLKVSLSKMHITWVATETEPREQQARPAGNSRNQLATVASEIPPLR